MTRMKEKRNTYEEAYGKFVIMNWFSKCSEKAVSIKIGWEDSENNLSCPLVHLKHPRLNMRMIICLREAFKDHRN